MSEELLDQFDCFMGDLLYDGFCCIDQWAYENSPGLKSAEEAAQAWMINDLKSYIDMKRTAYEWEPTLVDLCYETRLLYYQYAQFLVQNHRPARDLMLLTDEVLLSYRPIKQLKSRLDALCDKIEATPHPPHLCFRKYQETRIDVDRFYASATTRLLYYLLKKYQDDYTEREKLFVQLKSKTVPLPNTKKGM